MGEVVNAVVFSGRNFGTQRDLEVFLNRSRGQRLRRIRERATEHLNRSRGQVLRRYAEGCYSPDRVAARVS